MSVVKTGLLMSLIFVVLLVTGYFIGSETGLIVAFVVALAMNGFAYWFSDKVILYMYHAKEVTPEEQPRLHDLVHTLAGRAGLPMPKIYIMDNPSPNAFATGRSPKHAAVAVTTGILQLLTEDQLAGVLAHELSHVEHRDILIATVAATVAGTISFLAMMAKFTLFFGGGNDREERGNPIALLLVAILAPLAAFIVQMWISRTREYAADARGAQIAQNPLLLAGALKQLARGVERVPINAGPATASMFIVSPFSAKAALSWMSTHPPIEDRIARLEQMAQAQGMR